MEKTTITSQKKPKFRIIVNITLGFALFIGFWYIFVLILQLSHNGISVVPYPHDAFKSFFILFSHPYDGVTLIEHVGASLFRVFVGILYAFIIAIPLGIVIAINPFLDGIIKPIIEMIRPIPPTRATPPRLTARSPLTALAQTTILEY